MTVKTVMIIPTTGCSFWNSLMLICGHYQNDTVVVMQARSDLLSCCLTSMEARWPIRDGDRVGRGRQSEGSTADTARKNPGETVDRRQNNGSVKAVSPRYCPATCALRNCCFNCCAWTESQRQCSFALLLTNNLDNSKQKRSNFHSPAPPPYS